MTHRRPDFTAMEYGLLAALVCSAAIAALDARQFVFAGLCVIGSVVCSRRVGQAVSVWLRPAGRAAGLPGSRERAP